MKGETTTTPTKETVAAMIETLSDEQLKKVAMYVKAMQDEESTISSDEVLSLTKRFNEKYTKAFYGLAR